MVLHLIGIKYEQCNSYKIAESKNRSIVLFATVVKIYQNNYSLLFVVYVTNDNCQTDEHYKTDANDLEMMALLTHFMSKVRLLNFFTTIVIICNPYLNVLFCLMCNVCASTHQLFKQ